MNAPATDPVLQAQMTLTDLAVTLPHALHCLT